MPLCNSNCMADSAYVVKSTPRVLEPCSYVTDIQFNDEKIIYDTFTPFLT